jgi:CheY-like chemotaxis protein
MGGEVGVESEQGLGSCFWFTARFDRPQSSLQPELLPPPAAEPGNEPFWSGDRPEGAGPRPLATQDSLPAQAHEIALRAHHPGARVLIAEDNPVNLEVASELLLEAGLLVDMATDGRQAVELARHQAYDLILMDMQMPELDGLAATRLLRSMPRHRLTPILAMTANAFGDDRQACLDAGMDDHLAKPVDPELLYAKLGRWLPRTRPAASGRAVSHKQDALDWPKSGTSATASVKARLEPPATKAPVPGPAQPPAAADGASWDFSAIPGLTMSRALFYLPGRDQIFARVLQQFAHNYLDGLPGLMTALTNGQWLQARRLLHSMRGACGAVGAMDLATRSQNLEQHLETLEASTSDQPDASAAALLAAQGLLDALDELVRAVMAQASLSPSAPKPASTARGMTEQLALAVAELARLLEVADFSAGAKHREVEPLLRQVFSEASCRTLARHLRHHDYEAALEALHNMHPTHKARVNAA